MLCQLLCEQIDVLARILHPVAATALAHGGELLGMFQQVADLFGDCVAFFENHADSVLDEQARVLFLLSGIGLEYRHRQGAGDALGGGEAAGLRDDEVARVHIVVDVIDEIEELGRLSSVCRTAEGRGDSFLCDCSLIIQKAKDAVVAETAQQIGIFVGLELFLGAEQLFKRVIELSVPSGDDDDLIVNVDIREAFVDLEDIRHAEAARHDQHGLLLRVETQLGEHILAGSAVPLIEPLKDRMTVDIDAVLGNTVLADEDRLCLGRRGDIGVHAVDDIGAVGDEVGDNRDQRHAISHRRLHIGEDPRREGMTADDDIRPQFFHDRHEPLAAHGVDRGDEVGYGRGLVRAAVQRAEESRREGDQGLVSLDDDVVEEGGALFDRV